MIDKLMKALDEHIFIRYDPLREKNNFTIVRENERICDTDQPENILSSIYINKLLEENPDAKLCFHSGTNLSEPPAIVVKTCKCGRNYICPICGFGQGSYPHTCGMTKEIKLYSV